MTRINEFVLKLVARTQNEEEGATMVEYGLMVALIAAVCIAAVTALGESINQLFLDMAGTI